MNGYYYLNFSDLSEEAQQQLFEDAKADLDQDELKEEAEQMNISFDTLLGERAQQHIYTFNYVFNV